MTPQRLIDRPIAGTGAPTRRPLRRVGNVMAGCTLVAAGLALGPGVYPAAAVPGIADLPTPRMDELRLDGSTAFVTFTDYAETENRYLITIFARGTEPDPSEIDKFVSHGGVPGTGRTATRQIDGVPAGVALCAWVRAFEYRTAELMDLVQASSARSYAVCADPASVPVDLALENIRGNADPQASASPAYLVAFRNSGGSDATDVVVDISTSGVAMLGDQGAVLAGWQASGFSCAPQSPSGGQTAELRCTGGKLKAGEQSNPAVIVRFTGPGLGAIHASINRIGGAYANPGNDTAALNVRAT